MDEITITINGPVRYTPKWETLQQTLREMLSDDEAFFSRIARKDKSCDYRGPGEYELNMIRSSGNEIKINLNVTND